MLAIFAIAGHLSHASFAIAPLNIVPFGFPLLSLSTTAELSSNFILVPSTLLYSFFCLTITAKTTCFLISGLPLSTDAITKSPTPQLWILPFVVFRFLTVKTLIIFAPELSHVSILHPTGNALVTLAFNGCILAYLILSFFFPLFHYFLIIKNS